MKFFSENLDSLRKLYVDELQHLHSVETQIIGALPKMIEEAAEPRLKDALNTHLEETRGQLSRLETILREAHGSVDSKKSKVMSALASEGEDVIKDASDDSIRDAGIIAAAQKVEHFEIAAYGTVKRFAEILGQKRHAQLLAQTLEEEKHADSTLTGISDIANVQAHKAA